LDETRVDLRVKLNEFVEICDEAEEDQAEVFGPQIEIDLETGSDLGEPPVEATGEEHAVVVIGEETSEEGKIDMQMGTGDTPIHRVGGGDFILEDYLGDSFEKVSEINLQEEPQTPLA